MLESALSTLIPFRFLTVAQRQALARDAAQVTFKPGDVIIAQGDTTDRRVFVLLDGAVEAWDRGSESHVGEIEAGRYFGERAPLFNMPRLFEVRAVSAATCAVIEGDRFLALLGESPAFGQALGNILREKQGLFRAFDAFMAELLHGVAEQHVNFRELRRRFLRLQPALHHHAQDRDVIDVEALSYALRRLPDNITRCYMIYMTDNLDELLARPAGRFIEIETAARRRTVFEMVPGKIMVLLRDGISDLIDLITCLCVFAIEARKLRQRIDRDALSTLADALADGAEAPDDLLAALGCFTDSEREALRMLWPEDTCRRLYEIALHHEDFNIEITKQLAGYNSQHAELWTGQIDDATRALLGVSASELGEDVDVHIISSNTHSVINCLSPYLHRHAEVIEAWGRAARPDLFEEAWTTPTDRLYALARDYFRAHPAEATRCRDVERAHGMLRLSDTALTGIDVELIDVAQLDLDAIDPALFPASFAPPSTTTSAKTLIVNIDYAFGQQAEEIIANLLTLFGPNVRSVNVLGKAGALQGARGDVFVASSFVEQTQDLLSPLPRQHSCDVARLAARLPDREVFEGAVLTVAGTLLQNRVLLSFYKHIWRCVGLEMEGTFYLREVLKARHLGVIPDDVAMRFIYYVSDLPLQAGETLAGALRPHEGIPPLYAITREILASVLAPHLAPGG